MRILCVSDIVHKYLYEESAKSSINPDLIISCGDLPAEYLDFLVSHFNVPMLYVLGNHDNFDIEDTPKTVSFIPTKSFDSLYDYRSKKFFGGINIDQKIYTFRNINILGFEGCPRYNNGPHQYKESEMLWKVRKSYLFSKIFSKKIDIVVTHAPPFGIHDRNDPPHVGFKAFIYLINKLKPRYLLHGHTHLYDLREERISTFGKTTIVNCYGYYVLDI